MTFPLNDVRTVHNPSSIAAVDEHTQLRTNVREIALGVSPRLAHTDTVPSGLRNIRRAAQRQPHRSRWDARGQRLFGGQIAETIECEVIQHEIAQQSSTVGFAELGRHRPSELTEPHAGASGRELNPRGRTQKAPCRSKRSPLVV